MTKRTKSTKSAKSTKSTKTTKTTKSAKNEEKTVSSKTKMKPIHIKKKSLPPKGFWSLG
jgi:hypothetical protein